MSDFNFGVNVFPTADNTYNMGSSSLKWKQIYTAGLNGVTVESFGRVCKYSVTIPTTGWTLSNGLYSITLTVYGIASTDTDGKVSLEQSGSAATDSARRLCYNRIARITAATDSIVVYMTEVPTVELPISLEVIKMGDFIMGNIPDDSKANASVALTLTAAANGWSNTTPATQSITATGVTANNNIVVGVSSSLTSEQYDAAAGAKIVCTSQSTNSITLTAFGDVPSVDVPICVLIVG